MKLKSIIIKGYKNKLIFILFIVIFIALYFLYIQMKKLEKQILSIHIEYKSEIENLASSTKYTFTEIENKLSSSSKKFEHKITEIKNEDQNIIKKYESLVVKIICNNKSNGSGFIHKDIKTDEYYVVTNLHVISNSGICNATSDYGINVSLSTNNKNILQYNGKDLSLLFINKNEKLSSLYNKNIIKYCNSKEVIKGDKLIALGYPEIGNQNGITSLNGNISGVEESFYLTDASIGPGNSGGLAINVEKDCVLGVTTQINKPQKGGNALGRILIISNLNFK